MVVLSCNAQDIYNITLLVINIVPSSYQFVCFMFILLVKDSQDKIVSSYFNNRYIQLSQFFWKCVKYLDIHFNIQVARIKYSVINLVGFFK